MTVIIATVGEKGNAFIGGDSYFGVAGCATMDLIGEPKIRDLGDHGVIGIAGDPYYIDTICAGIVRGVDPFEGSVERPNFEALLVKGRDIFYISPACRPMRLARAYAAVGIGEPAAIGALAYAEARGDLAKRPHRTLERALEVCASVSSYVGPPFHVARA